MTPAKRMGDDADGQEPRPVLRVVEGGAARARQERELLAAFLVGDDEAFGELVRLHQDLVLRIVRRYARTPDDASDLAQRAFLRAFEAARRALRGRRLEFSFRAWLIRIAVNLAKNHLRDAVRFARAPVEALDREGGAPAEAPDALLRAEREARLRLAVLRLPRRQREVLTLRIDAELSFAEIADALGTTENAAKVSFHLAARRLKDELAREDAP